ncbi:MAG: T9SS C-terminal target domain-containing protein [Flavobacteriales bacterium]|nr:T9SS C-terminal target domain-containing protein [Flavobacteriales bacterium]
MSLKIKLLLAFFVFSAVHFFAQHPLHTAGKVNGAQPVPRAASRAAACAPSTAVRDLEWNNIEALIETGGSMWNDRATGLSHYRAPKGGNVSVLYAGSLWLGGISPDQQLKLAAITYRYDGNDYWTGPLTTDGEAEINESQCDIWDRFYVSLREDAQRHRQYFECLQDPDCDMATLFPGGYATPAYFAEYPAHGNVGLGQDYYLAPFYDFNQDGDYNPELGDYPWYDFLREIDCKDRRRDDPVPLFGDQTFFWIFNDKGNVHSESGGQPIGMEIRAQAFAFSTNDEINNMTFYNYVLINQGTQTLQDTYFGTWIDCDIGGHVDDFVGCDVQRGLGYSYNGNAVDLPSSLSPGYGENPPAMGVDFFEGPYQDDDEVDNPLTTDINEALENGGIPYTGIGIGYGDGIVDNERYGMRKFLYHNSGTSANGVPETPTHFYNYLRGYWRNGQRMAYGGNALTEASGADLDIAADYMFPGDTDPYHWGTLGVAVDDWTEISSGNPPADRRFMQSAGPFTLDPGEYNNITMGVVYARSFSGDPFESVKLVQAADDKAQALFDNCFEIISGPDAPEVGVQEMDREIILYLTNENALSNNYHESYALEDPTIPPVNSEGTPLAPEQRIYNFEGYLIYQLVDKEVGPAELGDITKSRLIAQCDVKNGIADLVNYTKDELTGEPLPQLMVQGADEGLQHSFRVTTDAFAQGDNRLVNHKTYYFMAIAYGYNEYEPYNTLSGSGQDVTFLSSRKGALGAISVTKAIPHKNLPENGGTVLHGQYGTGVKLTRHEGRGNGLNAMNITAASEKDILDNDIDTELEYEAGEGPVNVKVVDPLLVPAADFELRLAPDGSDIGSDNASWTLYNLTDGTEFTPYHSFKTETEDIVLGTGLAITWGQYAYINRADPLLEARHFTDFISASIDFEDSSRPWLLGIPDEEGLLDQNWIRAGSVEPSDNTPAEEAVFSDFKEGTSDVPFTDGEEVYEKVLGGTWSPYCLVSYTDQITNSLGDLVTLPVVAPTVKEVSGDLSPISPAYISNIKGLNNVDIVLTPEKDLWTRCPVFEMQGISDLAEGEGDKMKLRQHPSVDKNGNPDNTGTSGMGWFPGYAIDVGTGERLNMAFGEDSWLVGENGRDMIWNPTSRLYTEIGAQSLFGGQHWIYVFKNLRPEDENNDEYVPRYDSGQFLYEQLSNESLSTANWKKIMRACTWVGSALLNPDYELLSPEEGLIPNPVRIKLRVASSYNKFSPVDALVDDETLAENHWNPYYTFSTKDIAATTASSEALTSALDCINVVPNPYYAYSEYETSKLDNRVKITNLPEQCTVSIYSVNGTLIRQYQKADPTTSLDWDLKNFKNVPIASGVHLIHVEVPGIGEKTLKWFGVMRPTDLDNF